MSADDVARAIRRMAHEILEKNHGSDELVIIGMQTGGVSLARALAAAVGDIEGDEPPTGTLDATMHRDDFGLRPVMPEAATDIPGDPTGKVIVLVDDVLTSGATSGVCVAALKKAGAASVTICCFARVLDEAINLRATSQSETPGSTKDPGAT